MQWREALHRIVHGREHKSALITSYLPPDLHSHVEWWPLYRDGDVIKIHNSLLIYGELTRPFSVDHPWPFIVDYRRTNSEGQLLSEWETDLASMEKCLAQVEDQIERA
jgi:hypothetical protein